MKKQMLLLIAVLLGGCATAPWTESTGDVCDFEFPFVNDYDIVNKTTFRWDDSYVTNNPAEYRQEIAGPLSALAASAYGFRLFTDIRSLMSMGFPPERVVRCYGDDLRYDTPKYGRDFSRQPGVWDVLWQLTCTHSFGTYVAWMKSAEEHGPDSVIYNWDDEDDIPHNDWLIDDLF